MKPLHAFLGLCLAGSANAQLTITDSLSNAQVAQLLEGLNVSITNVTVNCAGSAMGHFSGGSEMEIVEGLVLTTGGADQVAGVVGNFASETTGFPGDADLQDEVGMMTFDACVLEFDCIPLGDTLLFNFSFGSEEYPEFVGSAFNDVFAIYLSGPGFPTPTNVAALPDGTPVAINNVNGNLNGAYFVDNQNAMGQNVAYDGFTTNLTVFAEVSPDDTYHFKVAIADVSDMAFDSGVFLEAFSFRSTSLSTGIVEELPRLGVITGPDGVTVIAPAQAIGAELRVLDAEGRLVLRDRIISDRTSIGTTGLRKGLYTLQAIGVPGLLPVRFVQD
ncbi:MAG: choice-of-anchor L domain-containing protein [Flavobacteriales bacterium]|nr:choice-of-anchor L domain-containing protein [Flavobacteriales bacterium]